MLQNVSFSNQTCSAVWCYQSIEQIETTLFNPFKSSGALSARVPERQKIKNGGLDQYGFEHFVV